MNVWRLLMKKFIFGVKQYLALTLVTLICASLNPASTPVAGVKRGRETGRAAQGLPDPRIAPLNTVKQPRRRGPKSPLTTPSSADSPRSLGALPRFADKVTETFRAPAELS